MTPQAKLRAKLAGQDIVIAPGAYDAMGALFAVEAGFDTLYVSGASIAYSRLGRPDIGLFGLAELTDTVARLADRVEAALIVDADTGFGNALNVQQTVRQLERAGAAAIQIEDQSMPKRCGHLDGKALVPCAEMVGKISAALDARRDTDTVIVARTDAIGVEGLDAALDRADAYAEAGCDVLFVEAPQDDGQVAAIVDRFRGRVPLLANMVEGGKTPLRSAPELQALGYKLAIFPGGLARAVGHTMRAYFTSLNQAGTTAPFRDRMLDFMDLNAAIGTPDMLERGRRYDGGETE
ncbi:MAG: oxaloacetate decarboxylase [Alphaproteobacteria bacterium]|nr:oxaloacetate decarboxylase [Alphaproteobacteria bacterium]MBO6862398.1 oxaloacetate decarboxylase [Alphaproteobacteria bacterium]